MLDEEERERQQEQHHQQQQQDGIVDDDMQRLQDYNGPYPPSTTNAEDWMHGYGAEVTGVLSGAHSEVQTMGTPIPRPMPPLLQDSTDTGADAQFSDEHLAPELRTAQP